MKETINAFIWFLVFTGTSLVLFKEIKQLKSHGSSRELITYLIVVAILLSMWIFLTPFYYETHFK